MARYLVLLCHFSLFLAQLLNPELALACPFCHTETGEQVRAGIFDQDFGKNLVMTLLPFPIFAGIVLLLHSGVPAIDLRKLSRD